VDLFLDLGDLVSGRRQRVEHGARSESGTAEDAIEHDRGDMHIRVQGRPKEFTFDLPDRRLELIPVDYEQVEKDEEPQDPLLRDLQVGKDARGRRDTAPSRRVTGSRSV
jgi:hypothetical protein